MGFSSHSIQDPRFKHNTKGIIRLLAEAHPDETKRMVNTHKLKHFIVQ